MDDATTTGTVVPKSAAAVDRTPVTAADLMEHLRAEGTRDGDAPSTAHDQIIAQVLSAKTPDAVLTPVEAMQGSDLIGVRLLLGGYELNKSDYDVGSPFYASMQCMAESESGEWEPVVVNTGHKKVLAQLVKLREFDQFPYQVMFRTRGQSQQGTPMLELVKWEVPEGQEPPF